MMDIKTSFKVSSHCPTELQKKNVFNGEEYEEPEFFSLFLFSHVFNIMSVFTMCRKILRTQIHLQLFFSFWQRMERSRSELGKIIWKANPNKHWKFFKFTFFIPRNVSRNAFFIWLSECHIVSSSLSARRCWKNPEIITKHIFQPLQKIEFYFYFFSLPDHIWAI